MFKRPAVMDTSVDIACECVGDFAGALEVRFRSPVPWVEVMSSQECCMG